MTKRTYEISASDLQNAIENTFRVFKKYKLDRKERVIGKTRIWNTPICLYDYSISGDSEIEIKADGFTRKKFTEKDLEKLEVDFLDDLNKIINKEIQITPEVANIDPYKPVDSGQLLVSLITLLIAGVAIYYGIKVLLF